MRIPNRRILSSVSSLQAGEADAQIARNEAGTPPARVAGLTFNQLPYFEGAGPSTSGASPSDSMTNLPYKATDYTY